MEKLPALSPFVKPSSPSLSRRLHGQVESQTLCPWCQGQMYLNRAEDRLLCADAARCAGVMPVGVARNFHVSAPYKAA
jgi:hypothetical protein